MGSPYLIGFGAGLVSAVLFASAATSSALALALLYLSPLPMMLTGLGWGWAAAGVAAISGSVVVVLALGLPAATVYFLGLGAPAAVLCYLALLSRRIPAEQEGQPDIVDWYPPGRLLAWATGMAGGLAVLAMLSLGVDPAALQTTIAQRLEEVMTTLGPQAPAEIDKDSLNRLAGFLARAAPAAAAVAWLLVMTLNMMLAGRVIEASGRALRPWPDIGNMTYPALFSVVGALVFALAFMGGAIGSLATAFAGAFVLAYLFLGLVIIHVLTRAMPFRSFILAVVYLAILFLGWVALIVASLGLCDPIFRLRERMKPPPTASGSDFNE